VHAETYRCNANCRIWGEVEFGGKPCAISAFRSCQRRALSI
jgi:hypothetical protein